MLFRRSSLFGFMKNVASNEKPFLLLCAYLYQERPVSRAWRSIQLSAIQRSPSDSPIKGSMAMLAQNTRKDKSIWTRCILAAFVWVSGNKTFPIITWLDNIVLVIA